MIKKKDYLNKRFDRSPFIEQILLKHTIPEGKLSQGPSEAILMSINDKDHYINMTEVEDMDLETFTKTFVEYQGALLNLTATGKNIMAYCISQMAPNKDTISISIENARVYCKYNTTVQVYRGLKELVIANVIAPSTTPAMWYINPSIMFNGKRFSIIKSFVSKHRTPQQIAEEQQNLDMIEVLEYEHKRKYPELEAPTFSAAKSANGKEAPVNKRTARITTFQDEPTQFDREWPDTNDPWVFSRLPESCDSSSLIEPSPAHVQQIKDWWALNKSKHPDFKALASQA